MELDWITPQQAAEQWGITDRRVQALCAKGQIDGAVRLGRGWLIPKNAPKPADGRKNNGRIAAVVASSPSSKALTEKPCMGATTDKTERKEQK